MRPRCTPCRVEGANTAPGNSALGGAHRTFHLPPFPPQESWQSAIDAHWGPRATQGRKQAAPSGADHRSAARNGSLRPDQARQPQHPQHQHPSAAPPTGKGSGSGPRNPPIHGINHAASRGAATSAFASVDIRSGGRTPPRPPTLLPPGNGTWSPTRDRQPGRGAVPAGNMQAGSSARQASSNGQSGTGGEPHRYDEQLGGASGTVGAGGQLGRGPPPAGNSWQQGRDAGAANSSWPVGRGTRPHTRPAGRGMGKGFPFQIMTGRGRGGAANTQQQREPVSPVPAAPPDLAVGTHAPLERGRVPIERGRLGRRGRGRLSPTGRVGTNDNSGAGSKLTHVSTELCTFPGAISSILVI